MRPSLHAIGLAVVMAAVFTPLRLPLTAAALLAGLLGCTAGIEGTRPVDDVVSEAVRSQGEADERRDSPAYYIRLASESEGSERQQHLLTAAQLLIERGDVRMAQTQLQYLDPAQLERHKQAQIGLLAARIALVNNNPAQALKLLPSPQLLDAQQQIDAAQIAADASYQLGYYLHAVNQRAAIDPRLDEAAREANHKAIWLALSSMPAVELEQAQSGDRIVQGWLELSRIMRRGLTRTAALQDSVLDWGTRYPEHPVSNTFIDQLIDQQLAGQHATRNIAVMLPLQGPFAKAGEAIRSGFLSAYFASGNRPRVRFYDTGAADSDFDNLYRQALAEGAQTIVGPLDKTLINRLALSPGLEIPLLSLNYTQNPLSYADNLFQFGLLPEDEARQAAELAVRQGRRRASILAPQSDWGERLRTAFTQRFNELGGKVVSHQAYDPKSDDYSRPIRKLFNIDQSKRRHRDLQRLLGMKLSFTPYRREDVDMVFLAATARAARGIMPALRFHHAGELPVYATSHVYTGKPDRAADRDLNGLMFCDLPWLLTDSSEHRQTFSEHWPQLQAYTRLFALGIDAFHLVRNLPYLQANDFARFPGETGNLSLDDTGRLHRELLWARFHNGLPRYIDLTTLPALPDETGVTGVDSAPTAYPPGHEG